MPFEALSKTNHPTIAIRARRFERHAQALLAARPKIRAIFFVKMSEYVDQNQGHQARQKYIVGPAFNETG
jgi:hypothetical protein